MVIDSQVQNCVCEMQGGHLSQVSRIQETSLHTGVKSVQYDYIHIRTGFNSVSLLYINSYACFKPMSIDIQDLFSVLLT